MVVVVAVGRSGGRGDRRRRLSMPPEHPPELRAMRLGGQELELGAGEEGGGRGGGEGVGVGAREGGEGSFPN